MRDSERKANLNRLARIILGQTEQSSVSGGLGTPTTPGGSGDDTRRDDAFAWPLDDKGQLATGAAGTGAPIRVAAGTDGQILSANSATATGLEWIDNTGGGAGGRYQNLLYELDGSGGFTFVTDGAGNPMYELTELEP